MAVVRPKHGPVYGPNDPRFQLTLELSQSESLELHTILKDIEDAFLKKRALLDLKQKLARIMEWESALRARGSK